MNFVYFDVSHAVIVHDDIIQKSGGLMGQLNIGILESIIEHTRNDTYYPEIEHKATHLFFSINKSHCFNDGNKRSAIALTAYLFELNCLSFIVPKFIKEMENVTVDVADNRIDKELLFEIMSSIIYDDEYSEELKLKIIYAKM